MAVSVEVDNQCPEMAVPDEAQFSGWVNLAQSAVGADSAASLAVTIVDEAESAWLNSQYRDRDRPTNVLSFPAELPESMRSLLPEMPLGDLAICGPLVTAEALERGVSGPAHWAHLVIHGTLHLNGYDHELEEEAAIMEGLEIRLMEQLGFANPYATDSL